MGLGIVYAPIRRGALQDGRPGLFYPPPLEPPMKSVFSWKAQSQLASEKWMWTRWWTAAFLAAALTGAAAGCGDSEPNAPAAAPTATATSVPTPVPTATPTPTATPSPTPTPSPQPAPDVALTPSGTAPELDALLESSASAMEAVGSFHFEIEMVITAESEGTTMEVPFNLVGDFQEPDRAMGKTEFSILFFTIETEFIQIGDTGYSTNPETGEWMIDEDSGVPFGSPTDLVGTALAEGIEGLELLGEETRDGVRVYHVSGSVPASEFSEEGAEGELQADLWIGVEDLLIRELAIEGQIEPPDDSLELDEGGTVGMSLSMKLSDFGVPVTIEAPELSPEVIASATTTAVAGPPGSEQSCPPHLDIVVSSDAEFHPPTVTSYQCLSAFVDSTGRSPDAEPTFTTSVGEAIGLSFGTDEAPTTLELRLYPKPGLSGSFMRWPEDLPGGPQPVESADVEPALDVSHTFESEPGDYSLVIRATWEGPVEVFYAVSLRLE